MNNLQQTQERLSAATLIYQQTRAEIIDAFDEAAPVTVTNLADIQELWDAYYDAATTLMRAEIAVTNTQKRAQEARNLAANDLSVPV